MQQADRNGQVSDDAAGMSESPVDSLLFEARLNDMGRYITQPSLSATVKLTTSLWNQTRNRKMYVHLDITESQRAQKLTLLRIHFQKETQWSAFGFQTLQGF